MAILTLNSDFAGCGNSSQTTNNGDVAWAPSSAADPYGGVNVGGFAGVNYRSVFRYPFNATLAGATINSLTFNPYFKHDFNNTNYTTIDLGPYHTNGQGDPVADALSNYTTSFGYAADVNQYVTAITTFRNAHDAYVGVTLPAQALLDFAAAVAASSVFTLYLWSSGAGNDDLRIDSATDPHPPQLIVDYTAASASVSNIGSRTFMKSLITR